MSKQISAIDIEQLFYTDSLQAIESFDEGDLAELVTYNESTGKLTAGSGVVEILNVHQGTWTLEESEASQTFYKNQLTGSVYRASAKEMGEVSMSFTIGRYDYTTKAALLGGSVVTDGDSNAIGWQRARGIVEMHKCMIALTEDKQIVVFPYANFNTHEANTDGAIGLAVKATAMEPDSDEVASEYWYDASAVASGGSGS